MTENPKETGRVCALASMATGGGAIFAAVNVHYHPDGWFSMMLAGAFFVVIGEALRRAWR